ncbi:hypothetical protein ACFSTC_15565 [Nonomuraea ferruginea]
MGGVGKSGLAVHWSHRVAPRFPDGQLFVDLNGYSETGPPVSPFDVLDTLLRALNVTRQHPLTTLEERAALFRTVLAGRQLLLVLDNARDSSQVRPLLPGAPGCAVIVTSRDQLAGLITLEGATPLRLDVLPPDQGVDVLACIAGGSSGCTPTRRGPGNSASCAAGWCWRCAWRPPGWPCGRRGPAPTSSPGSPTRAAGSASSARARWTCAPSSSSATATCRRRRPSCSGGWRCWTWPSSARGWAPPCWRWIRSGPRT